MRGEKQRLLYIQAIVLSPVLISQQASVQQHHLLMENGWLQILLQNEMKGLRQVITNGLKECDI